MKFSGRHIFYFHRRLCYSCKYGHRQAKAQWFCKYKNRPVFFILYCPYFRVSHSRDTNLHKRITSPKDLNIIRDFLIALSLVIIIILLIEAPNLIYIGFISLFMILFAEYYKRLLPPIVREYGWFVYLFLMLFSEIKQKNNQWKDNQVENFILQFFTILYGFDMAKEVLILVSKFSDNQFIKHRRKFIKKLSASSRILLFIFVAEYLLYKSLSSEKEKLYLYQMANILGISRNIQQQIIRQVIEYLTMKEEEKINLHTDNTKINYYLRVLQLDKNANWQQIKKNFYKFSLLYHPDKYANDPQQQKEAQQKYQNITQAYNYLKKYFK